MAMSTQRLAIIVIMLDLILAMMGYFIYNTGTQQVEIETYVTNQQNFTKTFDETFRSQTPDTATVYLDKQAGDSKYAGIAIWDIFSKKAEIPEGDTCDGISCNNGTIKTFYWLVATIIGVFNILLIIEGYLVLINKKAT